jgi:hypothetical protein
MLWPSDGRMMKEVRTPRTNRLCDENKADFVIEFVQDVRGIYDGSLFYVWAERRENGGKGW